MPTFVVEACLRDEPDSKFRYVTVAEAADLVSGLTREVEKTLNVVEITQDMRDVRYALNLLFLARATGDRLAASLGISKEVVWDVLTGILESDASRAPFETEHEEVSEILAQIKEAAES